MEATRSWQATRERGTVPALAPERPARRWKTWLVSLVGLYPLVLAFLAFIAPRVAHWPLPARAALFPIVLLTLMTYVIMPVLTHLMHGWLSGERSGDEPAIRTPARSPEAPGRGGAATTKHGPPEVVGRGQFPSGSHRNDFKEAHMPFINVKVIEGVFSDSQKREIVERLTDAMVSIEGENMRGVTWCLVEEVKSGDWAIAGKPLSTEDVKALAAGGLVS